MTLSFPLKSFRHTFSPRLEGRQKSGAGLPTSAPAQAPPVSANVSSPAASTLDHIPRIPIPFFIGRRVHRTHPVRGARGAPYKHSVLITHYSSFTLRRPKLDQRRLRRDLVERGHHRHADPHLVWFTASDIGREVRAFGQFDDGDHVRHILGESRVSRGLGDRV